MTAPTLTYTQLIAMRPCPEELLVVQKFLGDETSWNGKPITAAQAVKAGVSFDNLVWAALAMAKTDKDVERRVRLWLADCAARVLHVFEKERPDDMRVRDCIVAARKFARGEIGDAAGAAARDAAWAARAAARAAEDRWQFDRLVEWLSDAEPADWPLPEPIKAKVTV